MRALLVIDIQNDYFPGGNMELEGSEEAGRVAGGLLAAFRERALPVFHIQHISTRPGSGFFLPHTDGARIHRSVEPLPGETVVVKHHPNSFRETPLLQLLRDRSVTKLVIVGMMTHMCVDTTTRAACDLGFSCALAHDACAGRALSFDDRTVSARDAHTAYMGALNGIFARVTDGATILAELPPR